MFSQKNTYVLSIHNCNFICRSCLCSYESQNVITKHKKRCEEQEITSFKNSKEALLYWKKFSKESIIFYDLCSF